jgi:cytochrome b involved in lipid metabolism
MNKLKTIVTISLIIFIVAIVGALGYWVFFSQNNSDLQTENNKDNGQNTMMLTLDDILAHNTEANCWVIVNNKAYNVTEFIPLHPAGADKIIPNCGKDATQVFETRGGNGPHPESAGIVLQNYYVGDISQ